MDVPETLGHFFGFILRQNAAGTELLRNLLQGNMNRLIFRLYHRGGKLLGVFCDYGDNDEFLVIGAIAPEKDYDTQRQQNQQADERQTIVAKQWSDARQAGSEIGQRKNRQSG
jgi:hypothetical protein